MVDMNNSTSWAQGFGYYDQLRAVDDMTDFNSYAQAPRCYEKVWDNDNIKNSRSWAKGSKFDEQLKVIDNMKDFEL